MNAKIFVKTLNNALDDFEEWWTKNYVGKLGSGELENAIKDIVKNAWNESVHNMIQTHNFVQQQLSAESKDSTLPNGNVR